MDIKKLVAKVVKYFNRESIYKQLSITVKFLLPQKKDIKFELNIGGGSFTDGQRIVIGLPEYMLDKSFAEIFSALKAITGHEAEHVNSSDFKRYQEFIQEVGKYLYTKYGIHTACGERVGQYLNNSIEDGRIEKRLVNRLRGYLKHIKFFRGMWWKYQPVAGENELNDFLFAICTVATTGLFPLDWEKHYKGHRATKNVRKVEDLIIQAINASTHNGCCNYCMDIVEELGDYLAELLQDESNMRNLMDMLMEDDYNTSEADQSQAPAGSGASTHFRKEKKKKKVKKVQQDQDNQNQDEQQQSGQGQSGEEGSQSQQQDGEGQSQSFKNEEDNAENNQGSQSSSSSNEQSGEEEENTENQGSGTSNNEEDSKDQNSASNETEKDDKSTSDEKDKNGQGNGSENDEDAEKEDENSNGSGSSKTNETDEEENKNSNGSGSGSDENGEKEDENSNGSGSKQNETEEEDEKSTGTGSGEEENDEENNPKSNSGSGDEENDEENQEQNNSPSGNSSKDGNDETEDKSKSNSGLGDEEEDKENEEQNNSLSGNSSNDENDETEDKLKSNSVSSDENEENEEQNNSSNNEEGDSGSDEQPNKDNGEGEAEEANKVDLEGTQTVKGSNQGDGTFINGKDDNSEKDESDEKDEDSFGDYTSDSQIVEQEFDKIREEAVEEAEKALSKAKSEEEAEAKKKAQQEAEEKANTLTPEELDKIAKEYKEDRIPKFRQVKFDRKTIKVLPSEIQREAKKLEKELKELLFNKRTFNSRHQKRGMLDTNALWQFGAKDYNVFQKKGNPVETDFVFYVLQDGSGSMDERIDGDATKWFYASKASAVIEEAIKNYIPYKVATFSSGYDENLHYVVKDFKENVKENKCWNFYNYYNPDNGNKDGHSIRIASAELQKRPEKNKVLIVLSDGLPSAYSSRTFGNADVRNAVREARKNGIKVISIAFGNEAHRKSSIDLYKSLYQSGIISCEPEKITSELIKVFKKELIK